MKKIILLIISAAVCLSLCACGQSAKYKKYDKLISCIENGDYEGAHSELDRIEAFDENTTASEYDAIDITLENWRDYFEIVESHEISKNNFDEIEDMYKTYKFVLKEGYSMDESNTHIDIEFNYIKEWRYVTVDKEKGVLTIGELSEDREPEEMNGHMITVMQKETNMMNSREYSGDKQAVPCDVEIVRIQGKLYIAK